LDFEFHSDALSRFPSRANIPYFAIPHFSSRNCTVVRSTPNPYLMLRRSEIELDSGS
jgi:hypothetical protein